MIRTKRRNERSSGLHFRVKYSKSKKGKSLKPCGHRIIRRFLAFLKLINLLFLGKLEGKLNFLMLIELLNEFRQKKYAIFIFCNKVEICWVINHNCPFFQRKVM